MFFRAEERRFLFSFVALLSLLALFSPLPAWGAYNQSAAAYLLNNNDVVVWFYGQYGDTAPACQIDNPPGGGQSSTVGLSVNIEIAAPPPRVISFAVTPNNLNFGTLKPGRQASQNLTINNTGTVNLTITAEATGDAIFRDNLRLDNQRPQNWRTNLVQGQSRNTTAILQAPNNLTTSGPRNATLTFWAKP